MDVLQMLLGDPGYTGLDPVLCLTLKHTQTTVEQSAVYPSCDMSLLWGFQASMSLSLMSQVEGEKNPWTMEDHGPLVFAVFVCDGIENTNSVVVKGTRVLCEYDV